MTLAEFRSQVRAYANDPATGGTFGKTGVNELFPTALVDAFGEDVYREACNFIRTHSPGFFRKTLVTATSSTQVHTWPSDFVRLLGPMVVSDDGTSLESDETVGDEVPRGVPGIIHNTLDASGQQIWVPEQGGFRLIPKATTAGSKALLLRYEYIPDFPSTGSASFTWPDNHRQFLVFGTAKALRDSVGLGTRYLAEREAKAAQSLLVDLKTVDLDPTQFPSSFWDDSYLNATKQGVVK